MLMSKQDRKLIYKYLMTEGVLVAKKDYNAPTHAKIPVRNLFVIKACQSLTSRGYLNTKFNWQYYYYIVTPEGLDFLRNELHLPSTVMPLTASRPQKNTAPAGRTTRGKYTRARRVTESHHLYAQKGDTAQRSYGEDQDPI